jgi:hypothetical protein
MQKYTAVITVTVDEFEAHNNEHADDIANIFTRRILEARISDSSDIKVHVDTFVKEEQTSTHSILESVDAVIDMMNSGKVNPKDVYPSNRYHGD